MTTEQVDRIALMVMITRAKRQRKGRLGKTAMQKLLYLLQVIFHRDVGYRFRLHTYGPYDVQVMVDIDCAVAMGMLKLKYDPASGYTISEGPEVGTLTPYLAQARKKFGKDVDRLLAEFGDMNARDLEARATAAYFLRGLSESMDISDSELAQKVRQLKPKFSAVEVSRAITHVRSF